MKIIVALSERVLYPAIGFYLIRVVTRESIPYQIITLNWMIEGMAYARTAGEVASLWSQEFEAWGDAPIERRLKLPSPQNWFLTDPVIIRPMNF